MNVQTSQLQQTSNSYTKPPPMHYEYVQCMNMFFVKNMRIFPKVCLSDRNVSTHFRLSSHLYSSFYESIHNFRMILFTDL